MAKPTPTPLIIGQNLDESPSKAKPNGNNVGSLDRRVSELSLRSATSLQSPYAPGQLLQSLRDETDEHPFDAKAWINETLGSSSLDLGLKASTPSLTPAAFGEDGFDFPSARRTSRFDAPSDIEQRASTLITRLEFISQDTSSRLERTIDEIMRAVPRLGFDLQIMKENASALRNGLAAVAWNAGQVEGGTGKVLERLKFLDTVKTRMETSRNVLREVESWSSLEAEVKGLYEAEDFKKAGDRLHEASKSLQVFQNAPDYESRKKLLVDLQNQLEATVSPQLVKALADRDVEHTKQYYALFKQIQRETELRNYYFGFRRAALVDLWATPVRDEPSADASATVLFNEFLPRFYKQMHSVLAEEVTWCTTIFPQPAEVIAALIQNIMDNLVPSMKLRLQHLVEFYHDRCLPEIISAFIETESFGGQIDRLFAKHKHNASERKANRRMSRRMSRRDIGTWEQAVFEPFISFHNDYGKLEKEYLLSLLRRDVKIRNSGPAINVARTLADNVGLIYGMAEAALSRCLSFTHGYGTVGLLDALNALFESFIADCESFLDGLREDTLAQEPQTPLDDDDFDFDDPQQEDWANFQVGLRLLRLCWGMMDRLKPFETRTDQALKSVRHFISPTSSITEVPQASLLLLQQSSLNSFELHRIFDDEVSSHFSPTAASIQLFTDAVQRFVYDSILQPLVKHLNTYPQLDLWNESADKKGLPGVDIPTFSLSPTEMITRVGEQLLTLPEQFEMYADDEALSFAMKSLPFIEAGEEGDSVLNAWITSVARGVQYHLQSLILAIPVLSSAGAEQLKTDLEYVKNVLTALNMDMIEELGTILSVAAMEEMELKKQLMTAKAVSKEPSETFTQMAAIRGVTT